MAVRQQNSLHLCRPSGLDTCLDNAWEERQWQRALKPSLVLPAHAAKQAGPGEPASLLAKDATCHSASSDLMLSMQEDRALEAHSTLPAADCTAAPHVDDAALAQLPGSDTCVTLRE